MLLIAIGVTALAVSAALAAPVSAPGFELATIQVRGAFGTPSEDWVIYSRWDSDARRERLHAIKRIDLRGNVTWADSTTCPTLTPAVYAMEDIAVPLIVVPGADALRLPPPPVADGIIYRLSMQLAAWESGPLASDLTFAGNVNSPVARWHGRTSAQIASCWAAERP